MKKIKLLGISVAALGVIASVGGAIALFKKDASAVEFGFSAGTFTGKTSTVTYTIGDGTNTPVAPQYKNGTAWDGVALSKDSPEAKYEFQLGATYASDIPTQSYIAGNLKFDLSGVSETIRNKLTVYATINGYEEGTYGMNVFGGSNYVNNAVINAATYTFNKDVVVETNGTNVLDVYMKLDMENIDELTVDEEASLWSMTVTWDVPSASYEAAYVVGNGNMWTEDDEFKMVENIKKEGTAKEWMYNGLSGAMAEAKAKKGDTWSTGDNSVLDADKVYDVYWSEGGAAYFGARE